MQTLYNSLINGTPEYRDNGEVIIHPPTAIMLRAARTIKQLCGINDNNVIVINNLQKREMELLELVELMKESKNVIKPPEELPDPASAI